jgi:hypothetical protein
MRAFAIRPLSLAAITLLAFAGSSAAQDPSPALLNALEVRQLIERAEPGDHARLAGHFNALAEQYTAEVARHKSMEQAYNGTPRRWATGMSVHCKQLAELSTKSATTVRELAAYHQSLAAGLTSDAPRGGERFERGAGAPPPTWRELNALAAHASTPADHRALEEYFLTLAKRFAADANEHVAMAAAYRGTRIAHAAVHCDRLVDLSREAAEEATKAAGTHKQLAGGAR